MIRRELIKLAGGAVTGLAFTPVPWRVLGDTAMWSQNWSWMPRVPRGPVTGQAGNCTLCPAGCDATVRCAGTIPIGLWPRESAMCPAGLAAHTFAHHPLRLTACLHRGQAATVEAALEAAKAKAAEGGVAVLDLLPGRTASLVHRMQVAAWKDSYYLEAPQAEGSTAEAVSALIPGAPETAVELDAVKCVLSVATPLLDGWAAPARSTAKRGFQVWQLEAWRSRTADLADHWLAVAPGEEVNLLLAVARALLADPTVAARAAKLADAAAFRQAVEAVPVSAEAGQLAKALLSEGPAVVIADGDPIGGPQSRETRLAAAALNVLLGNEGLRTRPAAPAPASWRLANAAKIESVPDGAIRLLLIDEPGPGLGLPWPLVAPKLAKDAMVVALSWNRANFARQSEWMVPAPVFLETTQDAPPAVHTAAGRLVLSAAVQAREGMITAADFVARVAGDETLFADRIAERLAAAGAAKDATGVVWKKDAAPLPAAARLLPAGVDPASLRHRPEGKEILAHGRRLNSVSPLLAKLWQESPLLDGPGRMAAHPETLRRICLDPNGKARLEAARGALPVTVAADGSAVKGAVVVSGGPGYTQLCDARDCGAWELKNAKVVRS